LDRLDDDGRGAFADRRARSGRVAERNEANRRHERPEAVAALRLAGDAERAERAAVEAVLERDDLGPLGLGARDDLIAARQLQRRLVRLGAGVAEERTPVE